MKIMDSTKGKLVSLISKKLLVIIVTIIVVKGNVLIGKPLDDASVSSLVAAVCTYLGGQALVDIATVFGKKKEVAAPAPEVRTIIPPVKPKAADGGEVSFG